MINNDVLRQLRYIFDYKDQQMVNIFAQADYKVSKEQIKSWLAQDNTDEYKECTDVQLAIFLDGLINEKRGKKDGPQPKPEQRLYNNVILRKLKIALSLKTEDMMEIMKLADTPISKSELSAFFRATDHRNFRPCKDQIMRRFLKGLQKKLRPSLKKS